MGLLDALKSGLRKFDFFRTNEYFRYKYQPEYKSLFGGVLSLVIIIILIATFQNKLIDTLQKVIIKSDSINVNAADPVVFNISTFSEDKFMFGVEIWHHDLNTGKRYFDVVLTNVEYLTGEPQKSSKKYPLEPCTLDHWEGFPEVQKDFDRLKMNYWVCLPRNMKYNIQGKYASVFSQTLEVAVKKCTNESDPSRPCASQAQIDNFFIQQGQFFFTIYFINPLINPTSQDYLTYYLEDNNYIIFTKELGAEGILFIQEFAITTDESIMPLSELHEEKGGIVTQFALKNPYSVSSDVYCSFVFFKSGISTIYTREFQKLDEILSYIGGLFGTITIFLFFVRIYNETAFQIKLGSSLFQSKDQNEEKILKNYNFLTFLKTGLCSVFQFFGCSPNWKNCKQYAQSGEEMSKQLDVLYLLKRVIFLEKAIHSLMEEHQIKGIHFHQKLTLEEAKKHRRYFSSKRYILRLSEKMKKKKQIELPIATFGQQSNSSLHRTSHAQGIPNLNDNVFQIDMSKRVTPFPQSSQDHRRKSRKLTLKNLPYYDDDSSSFESQLSDSEEILAEIYQLKKEAKRGHSVSKKIWSKFGKEIKNNIFQILSKESLSQAQNQHENESLQNQKDKNKDKNKMSDKNLPENVVKLSPPIKIKYKRRKISDFQQNGENFQISNTISLRSADPKANNEYAFKKGMKSESREDQTGNKKYERIFNID